MTLHETFQLFRTTAKKFWHNNGPRLSAALTFYLVLSLSPLVLCTVVITGAVFGEEAARGEMVQQIRGTVGEQAATVIEQIVATDSRRHHGVLSGLVALITLVIGASGLFSSLQSSINAIWEVAAPTSTRGSIFQAIRERLLAFALVGGCGLLLLISLVVSMVLTNLNAQVAGRLPGSTGLAELVNFVVSFALVGALLAMIFKWLPDVDLAWSDVGFGAIVTAGLIILGRYPIGLYLHEVSVGSAFGAAEAFVVFLVWAYYSSQIMLFGAELTFVYASQHSAATIASHPAMATPAH